MFQGNSLKLIGGLFAFGAVMGFLVGCVQYLGSHQPEDVWIRDRGLVMICVSLVMGVVSCAMLIETGRAITGRIAALVGFVPCFYAFVMIMVGSISSLGGAPRGNQIDTGSEAVDKFVSHRHGKMAAASMSFLSLMTGYYVVYGRFPKDLTFKGIFGRPDFSDDSRKKRSNKKSSDDAAISSRKRRRLRPIDE